MNTQSSTPITDILPGSVRLAENPVNVLRDEETVKVIEICTESMFYEADYCIVGLVDAPKGYDHDQQLGLEVVPRATNNTLYTDENAACDTIIFLNFPPALNTEGHWRPFVDADVRATHIVLIWLPGRTD